MGRLRTGFFLGMVCLLYEGVGLPLECLVIGLIPLLLGVWSRPLAVGLLRLRGRRVYLGQGTRWSHLHSERLYEAEEPLSAWIRNEDRGSDVRVEHRLLARNGLLLGSPGSGKTQLLMLLGRQFVEHGHALIVLDPKSAPGLRRATRQFARDLKQAWLSFEPQGTVGSVSYDPLQYCSSGALVADRLVALLPGPETSFTGFCRGVLLCLSEGLWLLGEPITLQSLLDHLPDAGERLLQKPPSPERLTEEARVQSIRLALEQLIAHDRTHYQKMTAELLGLLTQLTTGSVGAALRPREALPRPRWDLRQAIQQGVLVYVGLDALLDPSLAKILAQLILMDIAALAPERLRAPDSRPLTLLVDEAGEIMCPALLQLLGKGRESHIQSYLAIQTLSDLTWSLGSRAAAEVVEGNCGAWFLFRQLDAFSREASERRLGEIPLIEESVNAGRTARSTVLWPSVSISRGHTQSRVWRARIPAALFAGFKDRECLAHLPDGSLWRLSIPVLG